MPISSETRAALDLLKEVQTKVRQTEDLRNNRQVGADLNALISVLESPVFQSILNIQDSLRELKRQVKIDVTLFVAFMTYYHEIIIFRFSCTLRFCQPILT